VWLSLKLHLQAAVDDQRQAIDCVALSVDAAIVRVDDVERFVRVACTC
jgi:hypothetical protein